MSEIIDTVIVCKICGNQFKVQPYRKGAAKFCSYKCYWADRRGQPNKHNMQIEKTCGVCAKIFKVKRCNAEAKFCSNKCVGIAKRLIPDPNFRRCIGCHMVKPITEFRASLTNNTRKRYTCRVCDRIETAKRARTVHGRWVNGKAIAKRFGRTWEITEEQFSQLVTLPCTYCGEPLPESSGQCLDRLDNRLGYTISNVVPACGECNMIRGDRLTHDEMLMLSPVLREIRAKRKRNQKQ